MERNCLNITVSAWANYRAASNPKPVNLLAWLLSAKYSAQVQRIRATEDKAERDRLKATLPAITPSGEFSHRAEAGLIHHSSLIQFDVDGLTTEEAEHLKGQLRNLEEVAFLGLSVSGKGLWGLVPIAHPDKHREHFEALAKDFLAWGIVLDEKPKNVASLRGYSWDEAAYFNPQAKPYTKYVTYSPPKAQKRPQTEEREALKVEACLEALERGRIDITSDYGDWLGIGFALASQFGEGGREYFHRASQFYPGYRPSQTDRQYSACLRHGKKTTLGTFFHLAEQYGVTYKEALQAEQEGPTVHAQPPQPRPEPVQAKQEVDTPTTESDCPNGYPASWDEPTTGEGLLKIFREKNPALGLLVERLGLEVEE